MLERSLARALGIEVGATLELTTRLARPSGSRDGGRTQPAALPVATPAWPGSPAPRSSESNPIARAGAGQRRFDLRIPSDAAAFSEQAAAGVSTTTRRFGDLDFETWQDQRDYALGDAQPVQVIVTTYTILLLIVAFVVVGILVGARASAQHREIGLLKAAGFTPAKSEPSSPSSPPPSVSSRRPSALRSGCCSHRALPHPAPTRNQLTNDCGEPMARPRELCRHPRTPDRHTHV